jgi:hypothetical protein
MPGQGRRRADRDKRGFHETPYEVTRAMVEREFFKGPIMEPACGTGMITDVLRKAGYRDIVSSDLHYHGFGVGGIDFLKESGPVDNIVTNPPFEIYDEFISHALSIYRKKIAVVARLGFLGGQQRYHDLWSVSPPSRIYMMPKRVSMSTVIRRGKAYRPKAVDYVWLVWDKRDRSGITRFIWTRP